MAGEERKKSFYKNENEDISNLNRIKSLFKFRDEIEFYIVYILVYTYTDEDGIYIYFYLIISVKSPSL